MVKTQKGLKLSQEVITDIENYNKINPDFNFSAWVEDNWIEQMMSEKGCLIQQKKSENSAKFWRNRADYLKRKRQNLLNSLNAEEQNELKTAQKLLKRRPELFEGRLKLWNNTQKTKLTKGEFKNLLSNEVV